MRSIPEMRSIHAILLALCLCSCMTQRKAARKIDKLLAQFPEMRDTVRITVTDTIYIPGDTLWRSVILRQTDTVTVENERQSVRIIRVPTGSPCDTAEFRADLLAIAKPDSIPHETTVEVARFAPCPPEGVADWWRFVAIALAVVLVISLLIKRIAP